MVASAKADAIRYQPVEGVAQSEVDLIKSKVAEVLSDISAVGLKAAKLPQKIIILAGQPTVSGNVDVSNAKNGFIRVNKEVSKREMFYALSSLGLKDSASQEILIPGEGIVLTDIVRVRDMVPATLAAAEDLDFESVKLPSIIYVLDGYPAVDSNVDASNVVNGWLRVSKWVTEDEFTIGFFRQGLKDKGNEMTFVPYEGVTLSDLSTVRVAAVAALTFEVMVRLGLKAPMKVIVLDGQPAVNGKVDATNAKNGFIRVSKDVTQDEISAALPLK
ncbi:MAG: hypothetical protein A2428_16770 [Bdellovibrionales bacterium RIFOXYC1_FULL_54_43]|nr:MAG: hypothetical protein A2428_16770 [Bdellovibrionales bacterium RIFOXYC1_FULL_54_43]OFZ84415.1 MAG: hypothetical protein A2603_03180 [Bdellovibrionales bacterium RIFOXYD1_FULL_55_31]